jgi:hypothetical protein
MSLHRKKALVVDHLYVTCGQLNPQHRAELFRAFAAVLSQPDIAALLFPWADEIEAAEARNNQLRLDFHQDLSKSDEQDKTGATGPSEKEDV